VAGIAFAATLAAITRATTSGSWSTSTSASTFKPATTLTAKVTGEQTDLKF